MKKINNILSLLFVFVTSILSAQAINLVSENSNGLYRTNNENIVKLKNTKGSYFSVKTQFYAETPTDQQTVTYYPNGTCFSVGYILIDDYWMKGTSKGTYYIKNNIIYVTWDGCVKESYRLVNNRYKCGELYFIRK